MHLSNDCQLLSQSDRSYLITFNQFYKPLTIRGKSLYLFIHLIHFAFKCNPQNQKKKKKTCLIKFLRL